MPTFCWPMLARSPGMNRLGNRIEGGDADASGYENHVISGFKEKSIAQRTDEVQGVSGFAVREPFGPLADDPVEDLEAKQSVFFDQPVHAERPSQKGVLCVRAADAVELAGDWNGNTP